MEEKGVAWPRWWWWGVITLNFAYHEKDIGATMANQLAQSSKLSQNCAVVLDKVLKIYGTKWLQKEKKKRKVPARGRLVYLK